MKRLMAARYPDEPGWRANGPSREAAATIRRRAKTIRDDVLDLITANPQGHTAEELTAMLGLSRAAVQPRISELKQAGLVMASGRRRHNPSSGLSASVWVLAVADKSTDVFLDRPPRGINCHSFPAAHLLSFGAFTMCPQASDAVG